MSRIRIKLGPVEVEYEGNEDFLRSDLPDLLSAIAKLHRESGVEVAQPPLQGSSETASLATDRLDAMTTGSIAAKLKVQTGPDLARAAAAKLILIDEQPEFSRKDLLGEMQSATGYYKTSYMNNLSETLKRALKDDRLRETRKGIYTVPTDEREALRKALAL